MVGGVSHRPKAKPRGGFATFRRLLAAFQPACGSHGWAPSAGHPLLAFAVAIVFLLCVLAVPTQAFARDYYVAGVDLDLTVNVDGSLNVVESRIFDFDGSYNGVYWDISTAGPDARSDGKPEELTVSSVQDLTKGGSEFTQAQTEADGTYQLIPQDDDVTRLKIFSSHADERATIRIAYTVTNAVNAWSDTGELYWKLVSSGWEVDSDNVTARVHLPVPAGESVAAGDNVRAWGHGPLTASLAFDGNDVVYTIPSVKSGEFAETRIAFPVAWLTGVTPSGQPRLSTILSEEQQWADDANAKREQAKLLSTLVIVGVVAVPPASGLIVILMWLGYRRRHKPTFQDEYFRDVPAAYHPAMLGSLYANDEVPGRLFTATLMRMTDEHAVRLDVVKDVSGRECDYQISRGDNTPTDKIDQAAAHVLFDVVGRRGGSGGDSFVFSDMKRVAKDNAQEYSDAISDWSSEVKAACEARGFYVDTRGGFRALGYPVCILGFVVGLASMFGAMVLDMFPFFFVGFATLTIGMIIGGIATTKMQPLSDEAIELKAKLEALKRWLCDFTLLKEAVPRDVILWNRLLVMAVALGVADEVIEQLRTVAPEILDDPGFYCGYYWYGGYGALDSPADVFDSAYESANSVASSELSDSDGGGGGFSSGGGGGGGDGGGGAF